jgi:hypothetical protein
MTDVVDTNETRANPGRVYQPAPQTQILFTAPKLPFYNTGQHVNFLPNEPAIIDGRPVLVTTDRPKSLAETGTVLVQPTQPAPPPPPPNPPLPPRHDALAIPDGPAPQPLPAPGPPPAPDAYAEARVATRKPLLRRGHHRPPAPLWAWALAVAALALAAGGLGGGLVLAGAVLGVGR